MPTLTEIETIVKSHTADCPPEVGHVIQGAMDAWHRGLIRQAEIEPTIAQGLVGLSEDQAQAGRVIQNRILSSLGHLFLGQAEEHRTHRKTGGEIHAEINHAFDLIEQKGRGIVYFGSARTEPGHVFYDHAHELGREVEMLLHTTSWSGAGPGQMQAALEGAREAGGAIAGVKIRLDEHQAANEQRISPIFNAAEDVVETDHFGPRKIGLADAGWPEADGQERCGFVFFPGAIGTLDEFFEVGVLKQLKKVGPGKKKCVPILLMDYENFYYHLLQQLQVCVTHGMVSEEELKRIFRICDDNRQALDFLADYHQIPEEQRHYKHRMLLPTGQLVLGDGI
ncbi:MAG: LOG family protein [Candidatus Peribacter sp.]|nr:LOG family protein [Candidatus Peribacter sp.]